MEIRTSRAGVHLWRYPDRPFQLQQFRLSMMCEVLVEVFQNHAFVEHRFMRERIKLVPCAVQEHWEKKIMGWIMSRELK